MQINFFDLSRARALAAVLALADSMPQLDCRVLDSPYATEADALVLATTSKDALCAPDDTKASLVISLGADTDNQHELADSWAGEATLYVDTVDSARFGDLRAWLNQEIIVEQEMTDFCKLLRMPMAHGDGRKIFVSMGSALFDNLTIAYILSKSTS